MTRILASVGFGLLMACASAPEKTTPPLAAAAPEPVAASAATSNQQNKLPPLTFIQRSSTHAEGKCRNDFDCYDTSGFPASGQRWECIKNKCVSEPLPNFGSGGTSPATNTEKTKTVKPGPSSKRSRASS